MPCSFELLSCAWHEISFRNSGSDPGTRSLVVRMIHMARPIKNTTLVVIDNVLVLYATFQWAYMTDFGSSPFGEI